MSVETTAPTALPPSFIPTLPGPSYTDPAVFAQEQTRIFEAYWFAAARAADIDGPGSFRTVDVGRENVLIVRGRDRALRAFLNVCRHRGARVCMEQSGTGQRKLQCGYHAWTYSLDGALVAAPNLTQMDDVDRSQYGLMPVHLREWLGYVWVCLADEPPSFDETVVAAVAGRLGEADLIDDWGIDRLGVGRRITYDVKANWKLIVENFMECYHCATIHPELTEVLPEFADGYAAQYFVGHGAAFGDDVQGFTIEHDPYEAGLGFAVRPDKGEFVGRAALAGRSADTVSRRLACLTRRRRAQRRPRPRARVPRRAARGLRHQRRVRPHRRPDRRLRVAAGERAARDGRGDRVLRAAHPGHGGGRAARRPRDGPPPAARRVGPNLRHRGRRGAGRIRGRGPRATR